MGPPPQKTWTQGVEKADIFILLWPADSEMWRLHLFGVLRTDVDGVESVLTDSSLVQVSAVTDLLLLLNDLCAVGNYCVKVGKGISSYRRV